MGVVNQIANPDSPRIKTKLAKGVTSPDTNVRMQAFAGILRDMSAWKSDIQLSDPALAGSVWKEIIKAADANYTPGKFTTEERAFFYARVLEIPTPRRNTYDAVREQLAPLTKVPATILERA